MNKTLTRRYAFHTFLSDPSPIIVCPCHKGLINRRVGLLRNFFLFRLSSYDKNSIKHLLRPGWQKLAAFRREQKWPQNFRQARICYFHDKCVVFARNCKFAHLIQYNMQYTYMQKRVIPVIYHRKFFWIFC